MKNITWESFNLCLAHMAFQAVFLLPAFRCVQINGEHASTICPEIEGQTPIELFQKKPSDSISS